MYECLNYFLLIMHFKLYILNAGIVIIVWLFVVYIISWCIYFVLSLISNYNSTFHVADFCFIFNAVFYINPWPVKFFCILWSVLPLSPAKNMPGVFWRIPETRPLPMNYHSELLILSKGYQWMPVGYRFFDFLLQDCRSIFSHSNWLNYNCESWK